MRCPFCKDDGTKSKVIDSRESAAGFVIRRRRECMGCERRYTTYERVEEAPLQVVKQDGRLEDFDRKKLFDSIAAATHKRNVPSEKVEDMTQEIEREVREVHEREVKSSFLSELVMRHLRQLDKIAYVRYASVYRDFSELADFVEELRPLLGGQGDTPS